MRLHDGCSQRTIRATLQPHAIKFEMSLMVQPQQRATADIADYIAVHIQQRHKKVFKLYLTIVINVCNFAQRHHGT